MLQILALSLLASSNGSNPPGDPALAPSVMRIHEIGTAAPRNGSYTFGTGLFPLSHGDSLLVTADTSRESDTDVLVELLRSMSPEEWEYEGRELTIDESGRLIVQAPVAVQESTTRFLTWMERELGRTTDLVIDVLTPPSFGGDAPLPAVVNAADVERYVQAASAGSHRRYALPLNVGDTARIRAERSVRIVADYDVEIAERSSMFNPIVIDQILGLRLFVQAAPAPGGSWIALVSSEADALGGIEEHEMRYESLISTTDRLTMLPAPRVRQDLPFTNRSFALSTFLPDGKALAIQTEVAAGGERARRILFVRAERPAAAILARMPATVLDSAQAHELTLIEHGSIVPPQVVLFTQAKGETWMPGNLRAPLGSGVFYMGAQIENGFSDSVMNHLQSDGPPEREVEDWNAFVLLRTAPRSADAGPSTDQQTDAAVLLGQLLPMPRTATVSLTLRRTSGERPIARCVLPIRAGAVSAAVVGDERLVLAEYSVEVAQGAGVADPQVMNAFQGLLVRLDPRVRADGGLSIDIDARAASDHGAQRETALGSPLLGPIDGQDVDRLEDRRTIVLPKGSAPRRVVLGDSGTGSGALTLEVEIAN